jgi:hypothetical protein
LKCERLELLCGWNVGGGTDEQESSMRALAIGLFAAASLALVIPASAEEVVVGVPGVGVQIGSGHRDRDRDEVRVRTNGFERRSVERCETTTIRRDDGSVKRIKRCRD